MSINRHGIDRDGESYADKDGDWVTWNAVAPILLANRRLRGWLRYIDEQYESERERELGQFIRNALAGKAPPKGGRR